MDNAAANLSGHLLASGWKVTEKFTRDDNDTGSFFSVCYKVEKDEEYAFLKAFNFSAFFNASIGQSVMEVMGNMINAFNYEKKLSNYCRDKGTNRIAFVKEAGEEHIVGYTIPVVPYLIFDLAIGDVRKQLRFSGTMDYAMKLKSLHDISVGLSQLHNINISHQDLKPSNILIFEQNRTKIGDIGRSLSKEIKASHLQDNIVFSGDFTYAPPEVMYGYHVKDWDARTKAIDCYLLGSLICFYFTGLSMNAILTKHIPPNFLWTRWNGKYIDIKTYLLQAFDESILEFEKNIEEDSLSKDLGKLLRQLCHPNPEERGHTKNISSNMSNFDLQRFVSKLDYLKRKSEISIKRAI